VVLSGDPEQRVRSPLASPPELASAGWRADAPLAVDDAHW
jgi:hypothetical protein